MTFPLQHVSAAIAASGDSVVFGFHFLAATRDRIGIRRGCKHGDPESRSAACRPAHASGVAVNSGGIDRVFRVPNHDGSHFLAATRDARGIKRGRKHGDRESRPAACRLAHESGVAVNSGGIDLVFRVPNHDGSHFLAAIRDRIGIRRDRKHGDPESRSAACRPAHASGVAVNSGGIDRVFRVPNHDGSHFLAATRDARGIKRGRKHGDRESGPAACRLAHEAGVAVNSGGIDLVFRVPNHDGSHFLAATRDRSRIRRDRKHGDPESRSVAGSATL